MDHCVKTHKLPKDFRFDNTNKPKNRKKHKTNIKYGNEAMDIDSGTNKMKKPFMLSNSKSKTFPAYTGRKFTTNNKSSTSQAVDMDIIVDDLKESLPE